MREKANEKRRSIALPNTEKYRIIKIFVSDCVCAFCVWSKLEKKILRLRPSENHSNADWRKNDNSAPSPWKCACTQSTWFVYFFHAQRNFFFRSTLFHISLSILCHVMYVFAIKGAFNLFSIRRTNGICWLSTSISFRLRNRYCRDVISTYIYNRRNASTKLENNLFACFC